MSSVRIASNHDTEISIATLIANQETLSQELLAKQKVGFRNTKADQALFTSYKDLITQLGNTAKKLSTSTFNTENGLTAYTEVCEEHRALTQKLSTQVKAKNIFEGKRAKTFQAYLGNLNTLNTAFDKTLMKKVSEFQKQAELKASQKTEAERLAHETLNAQKAAEALALKETEARQKETEARQLEEEKIFAQQVATIEKLAKLEAEKTETLQLEEEAELEEAEILHLAQEETSEEEDQKELEAAKALKLEQEKIAAQQAEARQLDEIKKAEFKKFLEIIDTEQKLRPDYWLEQLKESAKKFNADQKPSKNALKQQKALLLVIQEGEKEFKALQKTKASPQSLVQALTLATQAVQNPNDSQCFKRLNDHLIATQKKAPSAFWAALRLLTGTLALGFGLAIAVAGTPFTAGTSLILGLTIGAAASGGLLAASGGLGLFNHHKKQAFNRALSGLKEATPTVKFNV